MHEYFFISKKIIQSQVAKIIDQAGYVPSNFSYEPLIDNTGFVVKGNDAMALSRLNKAAKELDLSVEISSGPTSHGALDTRSNLGADGTTYTIDFTNSTPDTWTLGVYQKLPASPGLTSVSWKQTTVPRSGESGVQWTVNYLVGIANYSQSGGKGVYRASQKLGTSLGQKWAARFESGAQQLFPDGGAAPGQVIIKNESGQLANLAIGMDGDIALVQPNVYSNNGAQFEVNPTYWVALFKDVQQGQEISGNQIHGPLQAQFAGGATKISYLAYIDGKNFIFEDSLGQKQVASLAEMEQKLRILAL